MRWRIVVLAALAIASGVAAAICLATASRLFVEADAIYATVHTTSDGTDLTPRQSELASALSAQGSILQTFITPLAFGCVLGLSAILVVLAWHWEQRSRDLPA